MKANIIGIEIYLSLIPIHEGILYLLKLKGEVQTKGFSKTFQ